jgi:hypothetical protein
MFSHRASQASLILSFALMQHSTFVAPELSPEAVRVPPSSLHLHQPFTVQSTSLEASRESSTPLFPARLPPTSGPSLGSRITQPRLSSSLHEICSGERPHSCHQRETQSPFRVRVGKGAEEWSDFPRLPANLVAAHHRDPSLGKGAQDAPDSFRRTHPRSPAAPISQIPMPWHVPRQLPRTHGPRQPCLQPHSPDGVIP